MNKLIILLISVVLLMFSVLTWYCFKKENYEDSESILNHFTDIENKISTLERQITKLSKLSVKTPTSPISDIPTIITKRLLGRNSIYYIPLDSGQRNFLLRIDSTSDRNEYYYEYGIVGQYSNNTNFSDFSKKYNILYSFYEETDNINDREITIENMVSPVEWNGINNPYVFIRERERTNRNSDWARGWLQIILFPTSTIKYDY